MQQFKTDGDKINQFMSSLGASATSARQSLAEQLADGARVVDGVARCHPEVRICMRVHASRQNGSCE